MNLKYWLPIIKRRIKTSLFYYLHKRPPLSAIDPIELFNYKCQLLHTANNFKDQEITKLNERNNSQFAKIKELQQVILEGNFKQS